MDGANDELVVSKSPKVRNPKPKSNRIQERLEAAKEITNLFKLERYVYILCCAIAIALLFFCAVRLLQRTETDYIGLGALFGSGGLITYSTGRLIFMWNKILEYILIEKTEEGEE